MQPLIKMTNIEKAVLLHQLFPDEIMPVMDFLRKFSDYIIERPEQVKQEWMPWVITATEWIDCASSVRARIEQMADSMRNRPVLFGKQLFGERRELFSIGGLMIYAARHTTNRQFIKAIELLFGFQPTVFSEIITTTPHPN